MFNDCKLLARTNGWQIGMVIGYCMRRIRDPAEPTWTREDQCHQDDYNAIEYSETDHRTIYSTGLVNMVNSCPRPFLENGPTLTRLNRNSSNIAVES